MFMVGGNKQMAIKKDYKNAAWVVDLFNHCVEIGNEYLEKRI
jgi:hypothetical protein